MKSKRKQIKVVVKENFVGSKPAIQLFSELIEYNSRENVWTSKTEQGIMDSTTVKSDSCCSSFRR